MWSSTSIQRHDYHHLRQAYYPWHYDRLKMLLCYSFIVVFWFVLPSSGDLRNQPLTLWLNWEIPSIVFVHWQTNVMFDRHGLTDGIWFTRGEKRTNNEQRTCVISLACRSFDYSTSLSERSKRVVYCTACQFDVMIQSRQLFCFSQGYLFWEGKSYKWLSQPRWSAFGMKSIEKSMNLFAASNSSFSEIDLSVEFNRKSV